MASFTRNWDEANPTDATYAYEIDEYNRYLRVDTSDRLKAMIYGFTAGENDGLPGVKKWTYKQQSSAPATPNVDEIVMYALDDGTNCGLYAKNEDGYTKQILKKSGSALILNAVDADGVVAKTGAQTIAGVKTFSDQASFASGLTAASALASTVTTGTAPLTVASTTKVDNLNADTVDGYDVAAYAGGESYTFPGGLIFKHGTIAYGGNPTTVTFAVSFPTAILSVSAISYKAGAISGMAMLTAYGVASIQIGRYAALGVDEYHWQAWGH